METKYETGATSHAVNDLILFADNTRKLAERRDEIYTNYLSPRKLQNPKLSMQKEFEKVLQPMARFQYEMELGEENSQHIINMSAEQIEEFGKLYADDFEAWKIEHDL
jgi:hypothetical protein